MNIFSRKIEGDPSKPTLVLIHGLYSSSTNWYALARDMGLNVVLVDLPNHGHSPWSDEFNYRMIADTIKEIIDTECVVVGHSFGGRVAMMLAAECEKVKGVVMADISPVSDARADRIITMFHSMFLSQLVEAKRSGVEDIETYLKEHGAPEGMTSAVDQAYRQMNIEAVARNIELLPHEWERILGTYEVIEKPLLLIRGGNSPYVGEKQIASVSQKFTDYTVETIEGATHRLHHEYPEQFIDLIVRFVATRFS